MILDQLKQWVAQIPANLEFRTRQDHSIFGHNSVGNIPESGEKPTDEHVSHCCSGVTLAQEPVQDIDKNRHPELAAAQNHVVQASNAILNAQKHNQYDMHGHAQKARDLLVQVNQELKLAAEDANAASQQKK